MQEFIPVHQIAALLTRSFPHAVSVHAYSTTHQILKMPIRTLLQAPMANWEHNRPADPTRCEDIAHYLAKSKKPVDTMMYAAWNNKRQTFDILDGIHRYTALQLLHRQASEFGDLGWLWDSVLLLNVRIHSTEGERIDLFQTLNKSNPIPELYVRDTRKDKRDCIEALTLQWTQQYKTHFQPTRKPNRPNANRDRFMELLSDTYDTLNLTEETKHKLEEALERTNHHISQNLPVRLAPTIQEKCEKTGCWLFVYRMEELGDLLTR